MINTVFTTRQDGDMREKNNDALIVPEQIHGNAIGVVDQKDRGTRIPGVDGLVSTSAVRLGVLAADCVPVLAYDEDTNVIGAAHAGWRGTIAHITKNLLASMRSLGADIRRIKVSIGPHIGMCCYWVDEDRARQFSATFGATAASFFEDTWHVDIGKANYIEAVNAGVSRDHIQAPVYCTSCQNNRYFSYRKDTKATYGEQMGIIWISKE